MFRKSCAIVVVMVVGGCGTSPLGTSPLGTTPYEAGTDETALTPASFDGKWNVTGSSGKNDGCLTVQGGAITEVDPGCAGTLAEVTNSQVATIFGNNVAWVVGVTFNGQSGDVTFDMTTQPDGSLQGSISFNFGGGTPTSDSSMWVRM